MIVALLLLVSDPSQSLMTGAATRLSVAAPAPRDRFRIEQTVEDGPTAKDRAFAERGERCQVVGARMCTSRGRTILSAPLSQ